MHLPRTTQARMAESGRVRLRVVTPPALPTYLVDYLAEPAPTGSRVLDGSTPVVAFGKARTAKVATLGLNPSLREFGLNSETGFVWLPETERRLATVRALGIKEGSWPRNPSFDAMATVVADCDAYFERNPYGQWFDPLDEILRRLGHTYYGQYSSACHLDLSPWATNPVWRRLHKVERQSLVDNGRRLLEAQLGEGSIALLLINGAAVAKEAERALGLSFEEVGSRIAVPGRKTSSAVRRASLCGVPVIAWSVNVQSSFGVTNELKLKLAERVRDLCTFVGVTREPLTVRSRPR